MSDASIENVVVRPAEARDLNSLDAFIQPFVAAGSLLPRTFDELELLLPRGFVAERTGEIVGFAALEVYSKKLAEVRSLAVAEELRGKGVGKKLVDSCVRLAHELNVLEVMAITANEDFFRSCGFDFTLPGQKKALFIQTRDT
jgi:N-acetylglutamate synthase-like GNAT family acetyltransferase